MDPLSIAASVTGILIAAAQITNWIKGHSGAPEYLKEVAAEIGHIKMVVAALERFVDRSQQLDGSRAALIQLEDVVTVLTQTVLVFSELETAITASTVTHPRNDNEWIPSPSIRSSPEGTPFVGITSRLTTMWSRRRQSAIVSRLMRQLQRQKMSLSLLLTIIQW
jgi:hypothetical protein